jgi:hypothetical protein
LVGYDIREQLLETFATLNFESSLAFVEIGFNDGECVRVRVFSDPRHLVGGRVLLKFCGHPDILRCTSGSWVHDDLLVPLGWAWLLEISQ